MQNNTIYTLIARMRTSMNFIKFNKLHNLIMERNLNVTYEDFLVLYSEITGSKEKPSRTKYVAFIQLYLKKKYEN